MKIFERFMELGFPKVKKSENYYEEWRSRFRRGINYAKTCMDLEKQEIFQQVLNEYILENF